MQEGRVRCIYLDTTIIDELGRKLLKQEARLRSDVPVNGPCCLVSDFFLFVVIGVRDAFKGARRVLRVQLLGKTEALHRPGGELKDGGEEIRQLESEVRHLRRQLRTMDRRLKDVRIAGAASGGEGREISSHGMGWRSIKQWFLWMFNWPGTKMARVLPVVRLLIGGIFLRSLRSVA